MWLKLSDNIFIRRSIHYQGPLILHIFYCVLKLAYFRCITEAVILKESTEVLFVFWLI